MNDEEINRAIAEHLGWTGIRMSALWEFTEPGEDHQVLCGLNPKGNTRAVPDYSCDLNAMHEAEKVLTDVQCLFYPDNMREVITEHDASRRTWHATARQRAEAFLRTVGKWRGEE